VSAVYFYFYLAIPEQYTLQTWRTKRLAAKANGEKLRRTLMPNHHCRELLKEQIDVTPKT
jgi:hypothetical protein